MKELLIKSCDNTESKIIIENGLKDKITSFFEDKKYFLITNKTLLKLYPEFVYKFHKDRVIAVNDGEKYKNFKTYNYIVNELLKNKIERKDAIVSLGGGVVGDMAGFAASSVLRGVELIHIPTTLLAMCDSSIGGKTGFNSAYGKNLIGSFYLAKKVLIDPLFLDTLNLREYKCGLGEIVKYAFIEKSAKSDKYYDLIDYLSINEKDDIKANITFLIEACAYIKANVAQKDKLESNLRKILNFGHTYAHAFEAITNYKKFSHGEAVALGIKYASKLAIDLNKIDKEYFDKINYIIDKFELADKKVKFKKDNIIRYMKQDKKVTDEKINLLLPAAYGQVELFDNIAVPLIEASLL